MLEKIMDYIIKTLTVIGIGLMLLIFPGMGIIGRFVSEETIDILFPVVAISFFVTGVLLMILVSKFGIKIPPTKAEKRELQFKDFDELQQFLEKTLLEDGYVKQDVFFLRRKPFTNLKCVAIVYDPQLSNDRLKEANSLIYVL